MRVELLIYYNFCVKTHSKNQTVVPKAKKRLDATTKMTLPLQEINKHI